MTATMSTPDVLDLFRGCGAMLEGHFLLSSGLHSDRYFQCALLLEHPQKAEILAKELARRIRAVDPVPYDIVIGPAEDGGYVLLGLRGVPDCLFAEMPWGTADVLETTRARLRADGLGWIELEPRWDVDRPEDLPRWEALRRSAAEREGGGGRCRGVSAWFRHLQL